MDDFVTGDRVTPRIDGGRTYPHRGEQGTVIEQYGLMVTVKWDQGGFDRDWHHGNLVKVAS